MASSTNSHEDSRESAPQRTMRIADRVTLHGGYIDFRTLCQRVVSPDTRYLVIDLDRTVHFKRNVGELLGFELCAYLAYGEEDYRTVSQQAGRSRFMLDWSRPLSVLRLFSLGARLWAYPGLFYFLFGKMGYRFAATRRWIYRRFGSEAIESIQRIPRTALMHHLAALPLATTHELALNLLRRLEPDQVILREDIDWLRSTYPNLRVVISSASPRPAVEATGQMLGIEDVIYSAVDEQQGYLSSPSHLQRMFLLFREPVRISPPSQREHNAGPHKIGNLVARFPDILDPDTETVGITDTGYGEDHSWSHHFKKVVDVNSSAPFSPLVPSTSPIQEIHSAHVLTLEERTRRAQGADHWLTAGRPHRTDSGERQFTGEELERLLESHSTAANLLMRHWHHLEAEAQVLTQSVREKLGLLLQDIEETVHRFNAAEAKSRKRLLGALRRLLREKQVLERRYVQLTEPVSTLTCQLRMELGRARSALDEVSATPVAHPPSTGGNGGSEGVAG